MAYVAPGEIERSDIALPLGLSATSLALFGFAGWLAYKFFYADGAPSASYIESSIMTPMAAEAFAIEASPKKRRRRRRRRARRRYSPRRRTTRRRRRRRRY